MEDEQAPKDIQNLFIEKAEQQALKRKLRSDNLKAKDNYAKINLSTRVLKLQPVQKFLNKLKASRPMDRESILKEIDNFNLTNYLNEISVSISDQPLVDADISFFVQVCSNLHQSYEEFQGLMVNQLFRLLQSNILSQKEKDEKLVREKKKQILRLLCELFVVGFVILPDRLFDCIKDIIIQRDRAAIADSIHIALMFSQHFAFEILRRKNRKLYKLYNKYDDLVDIFQFDPIVPADKIHKMVFQLQLYVASLYDPLKAIYDRKVRQEEKMNIMLNDEGVSDRQQKIYQDIQQQYIELLQASIAFANNLDLDFEVHFGDEEKEKRSKKLASEKWQKKQENMEKQRLEDENVFDTQEERAIYEEIFDLRLKLPGSLFEENYQESEGNSSEETKETSGETQTLSLSAGYSSESIPSTYQEFRGYLCSCANSESADILAEQFMYVNNETNRKRLSDDIMLLPGDYSIVAPSICRLIAVINRQFPDIGTFTDDNLARELEFSKIQQKSQKDQKYKAIRLISELTKFDVVPLFKSLNILKLLTDSFEPHFVPLILGNLQGAGRYSFNTEETNFRFTTILSALTQKINSADVIPWKRQQILEAIAYSQIDKQDLSILTFSEDKQAEVNEFLRFLILQKLNVLTISDVAPAIKNLPWNKELDQLFVESILELTHKRDFLLPAIVSVVKSLAVSRPTLILKLVDALLDSISSGISENLLKDHVISIQLLGLLSSNGIVNDEPILNLLYMLIDVDEADLNDGLPGEAERQREAISKTTLACALLEQISSKKPCCQNILRFLAFFYRFSLASKDLPSSLKTSIIDLLEVFDASRLTRIVSLAEATELTNLIQTKEKAGSLESLEDEIKIFVGKILQKNAKNASQQ